MREVDFVNAGSPVPAVKNVLRRGRVAFFAYPTYVVQKAAKTYFDDAHFQNTKMHKFI